MVTSNLDFVADFALSIVLSVFIVKKAAVKLLLFTYVCFIFIYGDIHVETDVHTLCKSNITP